MDRCLLTILAGILIFLSCSNTTNTTNDTKEKELLKEFRIEINQFDLDSLYNNPKENKYFPITIIYKDDTVKTAKIRIRGDSSREYGKKSLKIVFDKKELLSGEDEKINLNSEWTDKSYIRQYLSSQIMREAGINTFETNFVKLFINGKYFGLYLQVENIDKAFFKSRDLDWKGNLYKATKDGACMSTYDDVDKLWEKKSNKHTDWQDLKELITILDTIPQKNVHAFLKENFEYDKLISIIAVNMLIQNSSTYYHNYYMYHDIYGSNKWQMFPWDMDKSLSYYSWKPYKFDDSSNKWLSDNVLVERVLMDKNAMKDILNKVEFLGTTVFNNEKLDPIIDTLEILLSESVNLDQTDQIENLEEWKKYLKKEKEFITQQVNYISTQLKTYPSGFELNQLKNTQIAPPTLSWSPSTSPTGAKIKYKVFYSKDYLFEQEGSIIVEVTDTFFSLPKTISFGKYFWKVQASDGKNSVEGFNTRNTFVYKKPTTITNDITANTVWKKENSPYHIVNDISVLNETKLTIEKGVDIIMREDINLYVKGEISILGEKYNEVVFRPENKQWGELHLFGKQNSNIIDYAIFNEGVFRSTETSVSISNTRLNVNQKNLIYDGYRQAVVWVNGGKFVMDRCKLYSNGTGEGMNINLAETEIKNSYFNNAPDAIEVMNVTKGLIYRNFVENSPDDAIDMNGCKNILATENYLLNNNDKAISVGTEEYGPSNNIVIKQNLIVNQGTAISVKDSSDAVVVNNTIINTNKGVKAYLKNNIKQYTVGGKAVVKNNIFYSTNNVVIEFDKDSEIKVEHSFAEKEKLAGKNNLTGNVGFVNPTANNYHLLPSSICVASGEGGVNMGCYLANNHFLSIIKNEDGYVLSNNNLFDVDVSGYFIKTKDDKQVSLPKYILYAGETILMTSKAKKIKNKPLGRIIEIKGIGANSKLFDNKENLIFLINE
jgi:spore coat protein CotH